MRLSVLFHGPLLIASPLLAVAGLLLTSSGLADEAEALGNPDAPVAGSVLGTAIHANSGDELRDLVLRELLKRYATEKEVKVSKEELAAYHDSMKAVAVRDREEKIAYRDQLKAQLANAQTPESEREEIAKNLAGAEQFLAETAPKATVSVEDRAAMDVIASAFIEQWKVHRLLHQEYGGRVVYQQGGPEPLDAIRRFLETAQKRGDWAITRAALEQPFWQYFRNDAIHDFYPAGSKDEAQAFAVPPWSLESEAHRN